jgi:polysaccharide chain length determinant protein (PEP-CTERM system associated)
VIPGKAVTPRYVIEAAWRRRWWIALPFCTLAGAALVFVLSISHTYRSFAKLQVLPEPPSAGVIASVTSPSPSDRLSGVMQETLTRDRLEEIIASEGLYEKMRQNTVMENVILQMRRDITFDVVDRDVFEVGFKSKEPQVALSVARLLVSLFVDENARRRAQRAGAATAFLAAQVDDTRKQLEAQEKKIEAYRLQYPGQLPSQTDANVQVLNNSQMRLRALTDAANRDRDQRLFLQRQLDMVLAGEATGAAATAGVNGTSGSTSGGPADELGRAQAELRALEERLTPEHPDLQRARRAVASLEAKARLAAGGSGAAAGAGRRANPRAEELRAQIDRIDRGLAAQAGEERELRANIDLHTRRIEAMPVREAELSALTRDYDDLKRVYSTLVQRQQEARMAADLEQKAIGDRFRVLEPARLPERPHSPNRTNIFAGALFVALVLSLGLAAAVEYRDSSLRDEHDVIASLKLPVLATIPVLNGTVSPRTR